MDKKYVTASELGEYVYCRRAWWLKATGYLKENTQMVQGIEAHNFLFRLVETYGIIKTVAFFMIGVGLVSLLILSAMFFFLRR